LAGGLEEDPELKRLALDVSYLRLFGSQKDVKKALEKLKSALIEKEKEEEERKC
jgi:hypothetical protein